MKNLFLLVGVGALIIVVMFLAQIAYADGGGFPTPTFTATLIPTSTITLAPPPAMLLNAPVFPTATFPVQPLLNQPLLETPIPINTPAPSLSSRLSLSACWPLAIVFILIAMIIGAVAFGRRVW